MVLEGVEFQRTTNRLNWEYGHIITISLGGKRTRAFGSLAYYQPAQLGVL